MTLEDIASAAEAADGVAPFNEATLLAVTAGDEPRVGDTTDAWALIAFGDAPVELAVHPDERNKGWGRRLVDGLLAKGETQFWAHGDLPAAQALAASAGLSPARTLLILRLIPGRQPETAPNPGRQPEGRGREGARGRLDDITIRPSTPDDIDAIIAVNARAFASHPEQGAMDRADFDRRAASDWFDHAGLFVAERDGRIVGFHWTKIDPSTGSGQGTGEVYVVGVDPDEQGTGLGTALTARGLDHLTAAGVEAIDLYVEGDNAPALAVYHRLGFTEHARDTLYSKPT